MMLRCMRPFREVACFEPISASTIAAVTAVAAVAAAGVSAVGSIRQGQAAEAAGDYNAKVATNNAISAEQAGAEQANRMEAVHRRQIASAAAAAGASGGDLTGSTIDVMADLAGQAKLDEETARWQARTRSAGFANDAVLSRFQGRQALQSGYVQAGSTLLSGAARAGAGYGGTKTI